MMKVLGMVKRAIKERIDYKRNVCYNVDDEKDLEYANRKIFVNKTIDIFEVVVDLITICLFVKLCFMK